MMLWTLEGDKIAVLIDLGKMAFYFRVRPGEGKALMGRAIRTLALVKAMNEAVEKGMITAWS